MSRTAELGCSPPSRSRATILAELAAVLRDADASITHIESAIARTSISPQEISARFGGTRELILAMASQLADSMCAPLTPRAQKLDLRKRLLEFGERVTDILATWHSRGLYRIAVTESIRHTGLARDFHEAGPGRLTQRLAEFLRSAQAQGVLRSADPHLLASHLLSSLRANPDVADSLLHNAPTRRRAGIAHVRNVIDLFLHGIGGGRPPC